MFLYNKIKTVFILGFKFNLVVDSTNFIRKITERMSGTFNKYDALGLLGVHEKVNLSQWEHVITSKTSFKHSICICRQKYLIIYYRSNKINVCVMVKENRLMKLRTKNFKFHSRRFNEGAYDALYRRC